MKKKINYINDILLKFVEINLNTEGNIKESQIGEMNRSF